MGVGEAMMGSIRRRVSKGVTEAHWSKNGRNSGWKCSRCHCSEAGESFCAAGRAAAGCAVACVGVRLEEGEVVEGRVEEVGDVKD